MLIIRADGVQLLFEDSLKSVNDPGSGQAISGPKIQKRRRRKSKDNTMRQTYLAFRLENPLLFKTLSSSSDD